MNTELETQAINYLTEKGHASDETNVREGFVALVRNLQDNGEFVSFDEAYEAFEEMKALMVRLVEAGDFLEDQGYDPIGAADIHEEWMMYVHMLSLLNEFTTMDAAYTRFVEEGEEDDD